MSHLLQLLQFVLPESQIPKTLHRLKRQYCSKAPVKQQFCAYCLNEVLIGSQKCQSPVCQQKGAEMCWYVKVSFVDHLKSIYEDALYLFTCTHIINTTLLK